MVADVSQGQVKSWLAGSFIGWLVRWLARSLAGSCEGVVPIVDLETQAKASFQGAGSNEHTEFERV